MTATLSLPHCRHCGCRGWTKDAHCRNPRCGRGSDRVRALLREQRRAERLAIPPAPSSAATQEKRRMHTILREAVGWYRDYASNRNVISKRGAYFMGKLIDEMRERLSVEA